MSKLGIDVKEKANNLAETNSSLQAFKRKVMYILITRKKYGCLVISFLFRFYKFLL